MIDLIVQYESSIRLSAFLGGFLFLALWEWQSPKRALSQVKLQRWLNNIALVVTSTIVVRVVLPMAVIGLAYLVEQEKIGLANYLDWPFWLKVVVTFILLDLSIYFQHAMFHVLPVMWRFHRVHHSDLDCDVTTGLRFHPVEILLSMLIKFAVIILLGVPVLSVILFETVLNLMSMFTHSNIKLNEKFEKVFRWFFVTPDMHRVHHSSIENETNSNFAFNFSLWDRIFATYLAEPKAGHLAMTIGLDQFKEPGWQSLAGLLKMPFSRRIRGYAINYRDNRNEKELADAKKTAMLATQLADSRQRMALHVEHTPLAVIEWDKNFHVTEWNHAAENIFGFTKDEALGKNAKELIIPENEIEHFDDIWKQLTGLKSGFRSTNENLTKAKNTILCDWYITPLINDDGEFIGAASLVHDITQQNIAENALIKAKEEAEKANEAKSEFLSHMSHELRTPMNAILGFGQLLELDKELTENQISSVQEIISGGNHLLTLINNLLDLSAIEAGKLSYSLADCSLNEVLAECLKLCAPIADEKEIEIINSVQEESEYHIYVDSVRIKQVLLNLLSNAIKYNIDKGTVIISSEVLDNQNLRIGIKDTGKGMTKDQQQKLFTSFERLGTFSGIEGTGIGLVIAKKLTEIMGGEIGVESELGKGSCFWIQVPLFKKEEIQPATIEKQIN